MKKYDHKNNPAICPKCDKFGFPWAGYFTCEYCHSIYHIESGLEVEIVEWKTNPERAIVRLKYTEK